MCEAGSSYHVDGQQETHSALLWGVTVSGYVMLSAMLHGTPSSSMEMFGSPDMTVRAEKSTRLPIRLPRTLPSFPFSRWLMDLIGLHPKSAQPHIEKNSHAN